MNIRMLIIPSALVICGLGAAFLGAWVINPTVFWCGVAVIVLGAVLVSPKAES